LAKQGLAVRDAKFRRPEPQRHDELGEDTSRVLVHLFGADELEDRGIGAIARALGLEKGILQYHLDRLQEAKFADMTGSDDDDIYWA
jgi:hypothetical protein